MTCSVCTIKSNMWYFERIILRFSFFMIIESKVTVNGFYKCDDVKVTEYYIEMDEIVIWNGKMRRREKFTFIHFA